MNFNKCENCGVLITTNMQCFFSSCCICVNNLCLDCCMKKDNNIIKNKICEVCKEKISKREGCEHNDCWFCEMQCCQTCCDISGQEFYEKKRSVV